MIENIDDILNIYRFGSYVYGTNNANSDEDYIIVTTLRKPVSTDINVHYFTFIEFQRLLDNCDIQMLECYFLEDKFKLQEKYKDFTFQLDLAKLRTSISTVSNGSWVKGKKKLTVMGDYDKYLGLKSLFHSIRILDIGIQIASHGKIVNYSEYNWFLKELLELGEKYDHVELWEIIDKRYREMHNKLSSEFKILCPKILLPKQQLKEKLINLFVENNCYSQEVIDSKLINKIISIYNEH